MTQPKPRGRVAREGDAAHAEGMENPASLTDAELLAAYQRTDGEPGDPQADALCAEIERRGLDI